MRPAYCFMVLEEEVLVFLTLSGLVEVDDEDIRPVYKEKSDQI